MARAPLITDAEDVPEADRLGTFPHPRFTAKLVGHGAAKQSLRDAALSGRMHHAWLMTGPSGIGKATLAYKIATFLLAPASERSSAQDLDVEAASRTGRQVLALSHPNLMVIRRTWDAKTKRFSASIPIDEVRRLRGFLGHRGGDGAWRVVIVDCADDLNVNAANALLKMLEEPPERLVFLVVAHAPGRLLPTIRSRCCTLPMAPLDAASLRTAATEALLAAGLAVPAEAEWATLAALAAGSVGRALELVASGGLGLDLRLADLFDRLPKLDWDAAHTLADELQPAAAEQRFEQFYGLLLARLARVIKTAAGDGSPAEREAADRLVGDRLVTWAELWETLSRDKADALALNLDRRSLVLETFSRLEAAARR